MIPRESGATTAGYVECRLSIRRSVLERAQRDIARNPDIEVGGKLVGYFLGDFASYHLDWRDQLRDCHICVEAYIDAGPDADRSATHHLSDTGYQHDVFVQLTSRFPDVQFLGPWHSHHPNGLRRLSEGDVETGHRVVDSPNHELDLLISSLAVDGRGLRPDLHHLFLRGRAGHYTIDPDRVTIVDEPSELDDAVACASKRARRSGGRSAAPAPLVDDPGVPGRSNISDTQSGGFGPAADRQLLAQEQSWLATIPGLRAAMNDGRLLWRGRFEHAGTLVDALYLYSADGPAGVVVATVSTVDKHSNVRASVELVDPTSRREQFEALLDSVVGLSGQLGGESVNGLGQPMIARATR